MTERGDARCKDGAIKRYRRYHGYDYSRGGYVFVTTSLSPRIPAFGRIEAGYWPADSRPSRAALDGALDGRLSTGHPSTGQSPTGHPPTARLVASPAGIAAEAALLETPRFVPGIALKKYTIMPDHVHMLLYVEPGLPEPVKSLGRFMAGFKRVAAKNAGVKWEQGYHDRICIGADFRSHVEAYIEQNPLKWALMHGDWRADSPPSRAPSRAACDGRLLIGQSTRVREPLESPALDPADYWRGLGSLDLLDSKLCALRISRRVAAGWLADSRPSRAALDGALDGARDGARDGRLSTGQPPTGQPLSARLARAAELGYVFISTFLSPGERELWRFLDGIGAKMIAVKERGLGLVYRPDVNETPLLAAGRLAILGLAGNWRADSPPSRAGDSRPSQAGDSRPSRAADSPPSRAALDGRLSTGQPAGPTRAGSLLLNDKITAMAHATGGVSLYVLPEGVRRLQ